jgi:hypothetical protein
MAGGMPVVFPAIAVCDGIAMGHTGMKYSLVTRDLIADSTECMTMAHGFDGLVCVPNCDKNVPGLLMAAARLNIPTVFVSGGPMLAGRIDGHKTSLSSMFEAVGSVAAGTMTMEKLCEFEEKACPSCGSCSGMYTANSMNCLTEAIGMGLKGNGTIPAVYSERIRLAKHAGMKIMELVEKDIKPRDIMTEKAFMNALVVDMALGCSTNSMLHLPAIAKEAGVDLILVACHWGVEKDNYPEAYQQRLGRKCIDMGADLVIGHHPHVLQGIEEYKGKLILHSLGNFCFGANRNPTDKDTMIFRQTFTFVDGELQGDMDALVIPCSVSSVSSKNDFQPTPLTGEDATRVINRLNTYSEDMGIVISEEGIVEMK